MVNVVNTPILEVNNSLYINVIKMNKNNNIPALISQYWTYTMGLLPFIVNFKSNLTKYMCSVERRPLKEMYEVIVFSLF